MAGALQETIRGLTGRLDQIIAETNNIDFAIPAGGEEQDKITLCKNLKGKCINQMAKITKAINELDKQNMNYVHFLESLEGISKNAELAIYKGFAKGDSGFLTIANKGRDVLDVLEQNKRFFEENIPTENDFLEITRMANVEEENVKLPEIRLPTFSGDTKQWKSFLEEFQAAVGDRRIPEKRKMQYLKGALKGEAWEIVNSYPLESKNYKIVMDILKKKFGDEANIKMSLHSALRKMKRASPFMPDIQKNHREIWAILNQLENLNENIENAQLIFEVESKYPQKILRKIYEKKKSLPNMGIKGLMEFLDDHLKLEEDIYRVHREFEFEKDEKSPAKNFRKFEKNGNGKFERENNHFGKNNNYGKNNNSGWNNKRQHRTMANFHENECKHKCKFCEQMHWEDKCDKFQTNEQRLNRIQELKICLKCFGPNHHSKQCRNNIQCFFCKEHGHNAAFCHKSKNEKFPVNKKENNGQTRAKGNQFFGAKNNSKGKNNEKMCMATKNEQNDSENESENILINHMSAKRQESAKATLLQVACAPVRNPEQKEVSQTAAIFLDGGCEITLILKSLADKLKLKPLGFKKFRGSGLFNKSIVVTSPIFQIEIICQSGEIIKMNARGTDEGHMVDMLRMAPSNFLKKYSENSTVCSKTFLEITPEILVGSDYYGEILGLPKIKSGFSILQTKIGKIITGRGHIWKSSEKSIFCQMVEKYEKWWELEGFGIHDPITNDDDKFAHEHFLKTVKRNEEGRYEIEWPIRELPVKLSDGLWICKKRLQAVFNKLNKTEGFLEKYMAPFLDCAKNGVIEKCTDDTPPIFYIPHHCVINEAKGKLRNVFDFSCKNAEGKSVNDFVLRGLVLLADICGELMRFRNFRIAICCDVKSAFHQIALKPNQRNITRFLLPKNPKLPLTPENIEKWRFTCMPFGIKAAPSLLGEVINYHLENTGTKFGEELKKGVYADNIFFSAENGEEAIKKCKEAIKIFEDAKMTLHEFCSNEKAVNDKFGDKEKKNPIRILGIGWDMEKDWLIIGMMKIKEEEKWTKRKILKGLAKTFDPLGMVIPANLPRKIFFQQLWKNGETGWDEKIDDSLLEEWNAIKNDNGTFKIRRRAIKNWKKPAQLHIFVDASARAFGAVAYLRQAEYDEAEATTSIIFAKGRLAPIKGKLTIPRLELMGAVAGKRMLEFIKKELDMQISDYFIWSDSKCVLSWILVSSIEKLPKFVKSRILDLRNNPEIKWKYVPTEVNPADLTTRGCTCQELKENKIWWEGPSFLKKPIEMWPKAPELVKNEKEWELKIEEIKMDMMIGKIMDTNVRNEWPKMVNISVGVCKALNKFGKNINFQGAFLKNIKIVKTNVGMRKYAEILLILQDQYEYPPTLKEIQIYFMEKGKFGMWMCPGRLGNSNRKSPIFLSYESPMAEKVCYEAHLNALHSPVRQSLIELRHNFWIPSGRKKMKIVINKCFDCRRAKLMPYEIPKMPSLPKERVTPSSPFENCGVDYAGPFEVRNGKGEISKVWIEVFTCMATRFTHLELISDLSAKSCIQALRRFGAEYGMPKHIISDNGTQYRLTSKVVHEIEKKLEQQKINWVFTPSLSPWFGGLFEAIVKIMKRAMRGAVGRKLLHFEELRTVLPEMKLIMNTRPLTYTYENLEDNFEILRPIDLVLPKRNENKIDLENLEMEEFKIKETQRDTLVKEWKNANEMLKLFWNKWENEYLAALRERADKHRQKSAKKNYRPQIGEIVLIHEKNTPQRYWNMGKIVNLIKSKDGLIRVAKVKCKGKILTRAIALLYPMELIAENIDEKENEMENKNKTHPMKLRGRKDKNYKEYDSDEEEFAGQSIMAMLRENEDDQEEGDIISDSETSDDEVERRLVRANPLITVMIQRAFRGDGEAERTLATHYPGVYGILVRTRRRRLEPEMAPPDPQRWHPNQEIAPDYRYRADKMENATYCGCHCRSYGWVCRCRKLNRPCMCTPIPRDPFDAKEYKGLREWQSRNGFGSLKFLNSCPKEGKIDKNKKDSGEEIEEIHCAVFVRNIRRRWRPCAYCGDQHMDYECRQRIQAKKASIHTEVHNRDGADASTSGKEQKSEFEDLKAMFAQEKEKKDKILIEFKKLIGELANENKEIKKEMETLKAVKTDMNSFSDKMDGMKKEINEDMEQIKEIKVEVEKYSIETNLKENHLKDLIDGCKNNLMRMRADFGNRLFDCEKEIRQIKNNIGTRKRKVDDKKDAPAKSVHEHGGEEDNSTGKPITRAIEKKKRNENTKKFTKDKPKGNYGKNLGHISTVVTFIIFLFLLGSTARVVGSPCAKNEEVKLLKMQECVPSGFAINQRNDGTLCWEKINCTEGHLRKGEAAKKGHCGEKCKCPEWTEFCTFYNGPVSQNSTVKNEKILEILESEKAKICSPEKGESCSKKAILKDFNQIELFDGEKILIRELTIELEDLSQNEYECLGTGVITGSPKFCAEHSCSEKGTKFCYYPQNELSYFVTENGRIPIKAWGKVKIKAYNFMENTEDECNFCQIKCTKEGVEIRNEGKLGGIELCTGNCIYIPHPEKLENISISQEKRISGFEARAKFFKEGEMIKEMGMECPKQDICEMISCTFCWSYLKNPHCYPEMAMILLAVALYFSLNTLYITLKILIWVFKFLKIIGNVKWRCLKWAMRKCKMRKRRAPDIEDAPLLDLPSPRETITSLISPLNPVSPCGTKYAGIFIVFLLWCAGVHSLTTLTADEDKCTVNKQGERNCLFEHILELSFSAEEQDIQILLTDHRNKPAGSISLFIPRIDMICPKATKFFSRTFDMEVMAVKRCDDEGSCENHKCSAVTMDEKIKELDSANNFPGVTQCMESEGGWGNGCFYFTPACMFYRFYAIPAENEILEVFDCPTSWPSILHINASLTQNGETNASKLFNLGPGESAIWKELEITAKSINTPSIPLLGTTFVTDGKRAATIDWTVESILRKFVCKNKAQAMQFSNCSVDPTACTCHPADTTVKCICHEITQNGQIFKEEHALPFNHNGLIIRSEKGEIMASPDLSSAIIQMKINGLKLKTEVELNTCKIEMANLTGCYDCPRGANLDLLCATDFGKSLANIICPSARLLATCSPKGTRKIFSVYFAHAEVDEECEVFCGSSTTKFHLKGTLAFPETPAQSGEWNVAIGPQNLIENIYGFDFKNLLKYLLFPKHLLICLGTLLLLFLLLYCMAPILLRLLLQLAMAPFVPRSVVSGSHPKMI